VLKYYFTIYDLLLIKPPSTIRRHNYFFAKFEFKLNFCSYIWDTWRLWVEVAVGLCGFSIKL